MPQWIAFTVLPNVELQIPIEGGLAALVPRHDRRVKELCPEHPILGKFLGKFTDAFRQRVKPTVFIVHKDAPRSIYTVEALASFRDAVAISTIAPNQALELRNPRQNRINFSNAFWFYPWMLDNRNEGLIASTPAMLGYHEVEAFKGQSSPEISHHTLEESDMDLPLLQALLGRWRTRYTSRRPNWLDLALFRSLNMANQAALTQTIICGASASALPKRFAADRKWSNLIKCKIAGRTFPTARPRGLVDHQQNSETVLPIAQVSTLKLNRQRLLKFLQGPALRYLDLYRRSRIGDVATASGCRAPSPRRHVVRVRANSFAPAASAAPRRTSSGRRPLWADAQQPGPG